MTLLSDSFRNSTRKRATPSTCFHYDVSRLDVEFEQDCRVIHGIENLSFFGECFSDESRLGFEGVDLFVGFVEGFDF